MRMQERAGPQFCLQHPEQSPILVTGPLRTGTSLAMQTLRAADAWVGTHHLREPFAGGPEVLEHLVLKERVLLPLLARRGLDPRGLGPFGEEEPGPLTSAELRIYTEILREILFDDGWRGGQWAWKDPKLLLVHRELVQLCPMARWVLCLRPRAAVLASWLRAPWLKHLDADGAIAVIHEYEVRTARLVTQHHLRLGKELFPFEGNVVVDGARRMDALPARVFCAALGLSLDTRAFLAAVEPAHWHDQPKEVS